MAPDGHLCASEMQTRKRYIPSSFIILAPKKARIDDGPSPTPKSPFPSCFYMMMNVGEKESLPPSIE